MRCVVRLGGGVTQTLLLSVAMQTLCMLVSTRVGLRLGLELRLEPEEPGPELELEVPAAGTGQIRSSCVTSLHQCG
jgi:hypothetical protein